MNLCASVRPEPNEQTTATSHFIHHRKYKTLRIYIHMVTCVCACMYVYIFYIIFFFTGQNDFKYPGTESRQNTTVSFNTLQGTDLFFGLLLCGRLSYTLLFCMYIRLCAFSIIVMICLVPYSECQRCHYFQVWSSYACTVTFHTAYIL